METAATRRVELSSDSTKKATFRIDEAVYAAMKECVEAGAAPSQTAFVEDAIRQRLQELRRRELESAYAAAARDPAFMADMEDTTEAFETTADDGLR